MDGVKLTFKQLFWKVWHELDYKYPSDVNLTYIFELTTPENQVVISHVKRRLTLHGVRHNRTYLEIDPAIIGIELGWEVVSTYDFSDMDELLAWVKELDPTVG